MAEIAPNWQTAGPNFHQEIKYVTHLRPKESPHLHRTSTVVRQNSVRRTPGGGTAPVSEEPPTMGPANLTRTLSRAASFKQRRRRSATPCAKFHHFLERLSWNARVKGYAFDQKYLQRQPSFVVTPDRSSYNFSFKPPDLVKRRPKPQAQRTSRPLAAWKNPQPLEVLTNNGQVLNLPDFLTDVDQLHPVDLRMSNYSQRESTSTATTSVNTSQSRPVSLKPADPALTLASDEMSKREEVPEEKLSRTRSTKITLPVRPNRSSSHSGYAPTDASLSSLSSNLAGSRNSALVSAPTTVGASAVDKTLVNRSHLGPLDLPQTPVPPIANDTSLLSPDTRTPPNKADPPRQTEHAEKAGLNGAALRRSNARRVSAPPAHARTLETTETSSPTALPSDFRPESWRRSAIIARNSVLLDSDLADDDEAPESLASVWSAYLQRAIAQRVVVQHQRRSAEIRQDARWSRSSNRSSELASTASPDEPHFGGHGEAPHTFHDSTLSLGSASTFSVSSDEFLPRFSHRAASIRSATSSRYASVPLDSPVGRPQSITSLKSVLGAVHSPRALARASQTELDRLRRQSMISDAVISQHGNDSPIKTDRNAPTPPPHGPLVTPKRFSQQVANAAQKYETLFADSQGEQLQSPWQPEPGVSPSLKSASSSSFEADDECQFPTQPSEIMVRKRPLPASPNAPAVAGGASSPNSSATSSESRRISRLVSEPAPAVVRQQSQWRRSSGQKRVKSTGSKEALMHARHATLESLWAAESSGSE